MLKYHEAMRDQALINQMDLREQLSKVDSLENVRAPLLKKIIRVAGMAGKSVEYTLEILKGDDPQSDFVRSMVAINPIRQSICEKLASDYIKSIRQVVDFQVLPRSRKNAVIVYKGQVLSAQDARDRHEEDRQHNILPKSVDFQFDLKIGAGRRVRVYAAHKFLHEPGGSQDGQNQDIMNFMIHAEQNTDADTLFMAFCDGEYFTRKNQHGYSRIMEHQAQFSQKKKLYVLGTDDLKGLIPQIIAEFAE